MEAKNKMIFGRLKNRVLRPQEQIADEVRRSVRIDFRDFFEKKWKQKIR